MNKQNRHLSHLSLWQRLKIVVWGPIFALAYRSRRRRFLGAYVSSWITWLPILLALAALITRMPRSVVWLFILLTIFIRYLYWVARRNGYSRFVGDSRAEPAPVHQPLAENEHISTYATGMFSTSGKEMHVLLQPSEYWKVPLGDHITMVKLPQENFLYQFFNESSLEALEVGWLIFGSSPLPSIAITFCATWGPAHNDQTQLYYIRDREKDPPCLKRTVYFSFEDEEDLTRVWQSIALDLVK